MRFNAVFLDVNSLDMNDLDLNSLNQVFSNLTTYPATDHEQDTITRLQGAQVAITNKVQISAKALEQLPELKLILISATGTNNVDLEAAKKHGVVVCNCQGYGTTSVAQHTLALIFALSTSLTVYDRDVRLGRWQEAKQFCLLDYPIVELTGKTLGILGYGELGREVARLAEALGMKIVVGQLPDRPIKENRLSFNDLLEQADIISLHCPLTETTKNLIDAKALERMKPTAFLINCARGGIVNEADLADALKNGVIAGAAVDVLSVEPPKAGNILLDYLDEPTTHNLIITPHSAWGSVQARQRIVKQLTENAQSFLNGQTIRQVNA